MEHVSTVFILICVWTETCSAFICANTSNCCLHWTLKLHPFMVTSVFSHRTRIRDLYVPSCFNFIIYFCFWMNFYTISTFISMLHLFSRLQTLRAQLSVKLPGQGRMCSFTPASHSVNSCSPPQAHAHIFTGSHSHFNAEVSRLSRGIKKMSCLNANRPQLTLTTRYIWRKGTFYFIIPFFF